MLFCEKNISAWDAWGAAAFLSEYEKIMNSIRSNHLFTTTTSSSIIV